MIGTLPGCITLGAAGNQDDSEHGIVVNFSGVCDCALPQGAEY